MSVFELMEGDVFSEEGIKAGLYRELGGDPFNPEANEGVVDFSEPVFLGFRTPATTLHPDFGGALRGIGWAKVKFGFNAIDRAILHLLDHAMEYGGDSIVVGESHTQPENLEGNRITKTGNPDAIGDGDLDVWVSRGGLYERDEKSSLWLNQGDGTFTRSDQTLPPSEHTQFSDLDNDGNLDALTNNAIDDFKSAIQTWRNNGAGNFSHHSTLKVVCGPYGGGSDLGDLNGDGFVDLFYVCSGPARVAINQGDATLIDSGREYVNTNLLTIFPGSNLAFSNMDQDGDLDAVIPNENFKNALWLNNGNGEFLLAPSDFGTASEYVSVGDIDEDGDMDILFNSLESQGNSAQLNIYLNEKPNLFAKDGTVALNTTHGAPRLIDIEDDNDLDILIRINQKLVVFRNTIEYVIPTPPEDGLEILDEGLKLGILTALGKKSFEWISEEDMASLEVLDLSRATRGDSAPMIRDFSGSSFFTTTPSFIGSDLTFLKSLTKLKKLKLLRNNLSQIRLPSAMEQLEILDLDLETGRHFEIPVGMNALKELVIEGRHLTTLLLPNDLDKLESIHVYSERIQNMEMPEGMHTIKRISIFGGRLESITFANDMPLLEVIDLTGNKLFRDRNVLSGSNGFYRVSLKP